MSVEPRLEAVLEALEAAVAVARRDSRTPDAPPPPTALRPLLRFHKLPSPALASVRAVLDADDDFRTRVLDAVDLDALDAGSRLFLERPEGWRAQLDVLEADAIERRSGSTVDDLAEQVERLEGDLRRARADASRSAAEQREALDAQAAAERRARTAEADRDRLEAEVAELREERSRAVRELKAAEVLANRRLEELRGRQAEPVPTPTSGEAEVALVELRDAASAALSDIDEAVERLRALAEAPSDEHSGTGAPGSVRPRGPTRSPSTETTAESVAEPVGAAAPSGHRTAIRLRRGVRDDSVEGFGQLLAWPGVIVLVDGYNVSMAGWKDQPVRLQRDGLIHLLGDLAARYPAEVQVVFDGSGAGERPPGPLPVRVHFTRAGEEADDRILDYVGRLPAPRPVVVVSSDRRVRDGARRGGANVVSADTLLRLARR